MVSLGSAILSSASENLPPQTLHSDQLVSVVSVFFAWNNKVLDCFGAQRSLQEEKRLFGYRF